MVNPQLQFGAQLKSLFFNSKLIKSRVDQGTRKVLSKFGAFVRQAAKTSIRRRKRSSRPGEPPTNQTGLLKRFIFFAYDLTRRSVIIGPARLGGRNKGSAPASLEYGGPVQVPGDPVWKTRGGQRVLERQGNREVVIKPRPYMGPSFSKELAKLPRKWRESVQS